MKLKHKYTFTNDRQLWRILISDSGKLIVEDRDVEKKLAYFSGLDSESGRKIFRNFQMEEKFWVGIETIYKDIIYFHKYAKPDMPQHKEIIAWDISSQKILWHNDEYAFLFAHNDKVYGFKPKFEGRSYYSFDYLTGEELEDLGTDSDRINSIRYSINEDEKYRTYRFPEQYRNETVKDIDTKEIINEFVDVSAVKGNVEYVRFGDVLLFNYYSLNQAGKLTNKFMAADMKSKKSLLGLELNSSANAFVPDSFFMRDNLLFLLKEKRELMVYSVQ
ncbi:MAG: DUF4905 domain-containing protein [Syntrophothermus sp.]